MTEALRETNRNKNYKIYLRKYSVLNICYKQRRSNKLRASAFSALVQFFIRVTQHFYFQYFR